MPVVVGDRGKTQKAHLRAYRGDRAYPYDMFDFTMKWKT
jgi:hypothetical protein